MVTGPAFTSYELHSIVTPLGVRFIDEVSGESVTRGLDVSAWPEGMSTRPVALRPAGSGVFAAHGLPGMRDVEYGVGDLASRDFAAGTDAFWAKALEPARRRRFVVQAVDREGRFLPMQARIDVPARGVARAICGATSLHAPDAVPLFSSPTRKLPATAATIRAELYDRTAAKPAAWAVVEARSNGRLLGRGMANDRGQVVVMFPYPEPEASWTSPAAWTTSPGSAPMPPLSEQQWTIAVSVRYARAHGTRAVPDACDATSQPPARILGDAASPSIELNTIRLHYGTASVLRTDNTLDTERGYLLVMTSGSPS